MLRSSSFFQRYSAPSVRDLSYLRFIISSYVKDSSNIIRRVDQTVEVPPVEGTPQDYSLRTLLSSGIQLNPVASFSSVSLDDLSLISNELDNEVIPIDNELNNGTT